MTTRRFSGIAVTSLATVLLAFPAADATDSDALAAERGTRHALIVAVSDYLNEEVRDLYGPANDARLGADVLTNWGFERPNIRIVADKVEGAELPTREEIVRAMAELLDAVREGDFVYLHFGGHGSRQPVVSRGDGASEEADGLDETFLPRDIGYWDKGAPVENAIVDDEINSFVTSLRNKGVFVWIVFDSCHSGDMTRSIEPDGELSREIDFMHLVRPADRDDALAALEEARTGQVHTRGSREAEHSFSGDEAALDDDAAGYVAFFASQTTQETVELRLPEGVRPRQQHGLFTFTIMNLVQTNPGLTYRQLGEQVMLSYEAMHRTRSTPLFIGTSLDAHVFGVAEGERVEQYRLDVASGEITLPAGSLHNVTSGTILAVVPQPGADDADVIGYLEVTSAQLSESRAMPVEFGGVEAFDVESIPDAAFARPVQRPLSLTMAIALPEDEELADSIKDAVASDEDGLENMIEWVGARETASLRLFARDGDLWFVPPSGQLCTRDILRSGEDGACRTDADITPSVAFSSRGGARELLEYLRTVIRATNLMNVVRATSSGGSADVVLTMEIKGDGESEFEPVLAGVRPALRPGDLVRFRIDNLSGQAQDVTVLFLDARWGISAFYPVRHGGGNRIEADGRLFLPISGEGYLVDAETTGLERMLMIAVPARGSIPADFSYLEQPRLVATRALGETSELRSLLDQAGFEGGQTRGLGRQAQEDTTTQLLTWRTESE